MKKLTTIKQLFFAGMLIAGMNIYSSCDSCNRKPDGSTEGTTDGIDANGDTRGSEEPADNENSGSTEGTGGGTVNDGRTSSTKIKSTPVNTKTQNQAASSTSKNNSSGDAEVTNMVENSDAKSGTVDKNGNPVRSSGVSGSGQGTGTGSTGNNSRVTTREAQNSN